MLENLHFSYDGKSSKDFGVVLVNPSGGLYKEQFLPNRKIVETTVAGRYNPFLQRVDSDPLSFSLHIYMPEWEERNNLRQISRWLYQDYYKPLIFESNPDVIYYAMIEGKSELTHNGLFNGYISLSVRTNSPYCYSIPHEDNFTLNFNTEREIYNNGDLPMHLDMEVTGKTDDVATFLMEDLTNGQSFSLYSVKRNETIYVDGKNEILISSLEKAEGRYPQNDHPDKWVVIPPDSSAKLKFYGSFNVKLKYQYAYLNTDIELIGKVGGNC